MNAHTNMRPATLPMPPVHVAPIPAGAASLDKNGCYCLLQYVGNGALLTMGSFIPTPRKAMEAEAANYHCVEQWIEQGDGEFRSGDGRWLIR